MCKVYDFMLEMEKRYDSKNILWDTTCILEGITDTLESLEKFKKTKHPDDMGDILGIYMSFSFTVNHLIEHNLDFEYKNNLKALENLCVSFQEHILRLAQEVNVAYNQKASGDLLEEMYTQTKIIWNKEADKIRLTEIKKDLNSEEIKDLAVKIIGFNSETDHGNILSHFIKLCA